MDIGFPNPWNFKDSISVFFAFLSLTSTAIAVHYEELASEREIESRAPEPVFLGMPDYQRQEELAKLRAERRESIAMGSNFQRIGNAIFIFSVFSGIVSSMPWLAFLGFLAIFFIIVYAAHKQASETKLNKQRIELLRLFREIVMHSTSFPYLMDSTIYAHIERVFTTPANQLDALEQNLRIALIEAVNEAKGYNRKRSCRFPGVAEIRPA